MWIEHGGRRHYAYTGGRPFDPDLPAAVFVHGAQHDHSVWGLQSRYLAHHGYSVLALDLPGHGRSDGPADTSIERMAESLLDTLRTCGARRPFLIGHSMGALVALEAAARAPQLVTGLALLGAASPMAVSDTLLEAAANDEARALDVINRWSHSGITFKPGSPGPGFSVYWQNRRLMARQQPGVLLNDFVACNGYESGLDAASRLRCPVMFVVGMRDQMTPPKAMRLLRSACEKNPGIEVSQIDIAGSGHAMMAEYPDQVLSALRGFLERA